LLTEGFCDIINKIIDICKEVFMANKSEKIFGNQMKPSVVRAAQKSKQKYEGKFGDDSNVNYPLQIVDNEFIGDILGVKNIIISDEEGGYEFDHEKGIIVGNIRMGFGHYRISMAIASQANALGLTPYWMDLNSYTQTTGGKVINDQNKLYSMGSRISQKSTAFNKFVWEPLNYEGFRKISYNASDQMNATLMTSVFRNVPKDIPLVATHVWPAQAAIGAGMENVVNAIPDNWPMALHLAEGSIHTVQTYSALFGYRTLHGMNKDKLLKPMPKDAIRYVGHYVDDEIVRNIEVDCRKREERLKGGEPVRFLLTIGGAGAQREIFEAIIKYLIPHIKCGRAALFINVGDYINVWEELVSNIEGLLEMSVLHMDDWMDTTSFGREILDGDSTIKGIHTFYHKNIFEAVYCTNLLMRGVDCLVTKPSELAFYPVPKLFIKRVGGHERWNAIHSAEIGDGTIECESIKFTLQTIKLILKDRDILNAMCENIVENKKRKIYDGAIEVVKMANELRKKQ